MHDRGWGLKRKRRGKTKSASVCEPPEFVQDQVTYQFHGSRVATLQMKRVEVQTEKKGGRSNKPHVQKETSLGYMMGEMGNRVGSIGRWEEMLLISVVFPSYCHFLCSWSLVERERKTELRRSEI